MATDEVADFEQRNTDPTVPFDGSDPANIPGPGSNVQLEIAAHKRAEAAAGLSTYLRPAQADQEAESGDVVSDSDVNANPAGGMTVGEDVGAKARADAKAAADKAEADAKARTELGTSGRTSRSGKQQTS